MAMMQFPKQVSFKTLQKNAETEMRTSVERHLKWAGLALQYVAKAMTVGAANKFSDEWSSHGMSFVCVAAMRLGGENQTSAILNRKNMVYRIAETAKSTGCGNCGEQSAIAFQYLDENGISPLDWMHRANGDHAFVVIGRAKGSKVDQYRTWGDVAVVCDPWKEESYVASDIGKRNGEKWVYASMLRTGD